MRPIDPLLAQSEERPGVAMIAGAIDPGAAVRDAAASGVHFAGSRVDDGRVHRVESHGADGKRGHAVEERRPVLPAVERADDPSLRGAGKDGVGVRGIDGEVGDATADVGRPPEVPGAAGLTARRGLRADTLRVCLRRVPDILGDPPLRVRAFEEEPGVGSLGRAASSTAGSLPWRQAERRPIPPARSTAAAKTVRIGRRNRGRAGMVPPRQR